MGWYTIRALTVNDIFANTNSKSWVTRYTCVYTNHTEVLHAYLWHLVWIQIPFFALTKNTAADKFHTMLGTTVWRCCNIKPKIHFEKVLVTIKKSKILFEVHEKKAGWNISLAYMVEYISCTGIEFWLNASIYETIEIRNKVR